MLEYLAAQCDISDSQQGSGVSDPVPQNTAAGYLIGDRRSAVHCRVPHQEHASSLMVGIDNIHA